MIEGSGRFPTLKGFGTPSAPSHSLWIFICLSFLFMASFMLSILQLIPLFYFCFLLTFPFYSFPLQSISCVLAVPPLSLLLPLAFIQTASHLFYFLHRGFIGLMITRALNPKSKLQHSRPNPRPARFHPSSTSGVRHTNRQWIPRWFYS